MIANLFEEYKFFSKYPERHLKIAAVLFEFTVWEGGSGGSGKGSEPSGSFIVHELQQKHWWLLLREEKLLLRYSIILLSFYESSILNDGLHYMQWICQCKGFVFYKLWLL